jgi:hypothetical protein
MFRSLVAAAGVLALCACGGNKTAQQQEAAPPPAQTESPAAAPETGADTATAAPATSEPVPIPASPAPKPTPRPTNTPVAQAPKPKPEPPAPVVKTLAIGTEITAELVDAASSKTSQVGDIVKARVTQDVSVDGITVVPAGSTITGTVTESVPVKKIGGQATLGLKFDTLELPGGGSTPIVAGLLTKGKSETGKDAGTIAGATAGGALLGRLLSKHDKTKGTLIGAAVGAAAGTGAAAATKGQEVDLPAGTPFAFKLEQAAEVTVHP